MTAAGAQDAVVEIDGRIMRVTINRPRQRNAMTLAAATAIAAAMTRLDEDDSLTAAVITGAGGTFCAGMDLKRFAQGEVARIPGRGFGGLTEAPPRKPLIAAVEGHAVGGGFEIVLAADIVVASESATFGLPEVKRGLVARGGGAVRLPRRLPRAIAMELLLTGRPISAHRAEHFGLVNEVVPTGEALASAMALAQVIAENAPLALAATKQIVDMSGEKTEKEMFALQATILDPVFASDDAAEGSRAFADRRKPVWRGR